MEIRRYGSILFYLFSGGNLSIVVKKIHPLDRFCAKYNIIHDLIDLGKPVQNRHSIEKLL